MSGVRQAFAKTFQAPAASIRCSRAWLCCALASSSASSQRYAPGQGLATLAAAIVAVIIINGLFSFWQEYRAEGTMAALQGLLPRQVKVQRDGTVVELPADDVVPGDVILLSAGDHVLGGACRNGRVLLRAFCLGMALGAGAVSR